MESSSLSSFPSPSSLSSDVDASLNLSDRLRAFKTSQFDADAYVTTKCQTMNEKEIKHLCSYLVELKKASAEEMRKSVYANYAAFIRTSKEISDLEGQLISMRSLLSSQAGFLHSLAQGVRVNKVLNEDDDDDARSGEWEERRSSSNSKNKNEGRVAEFVDEVEVLLAERRVQEALKAVETAPAWVPREAVGEQRRRLAEELAESMERPWAARSELRSAAAALRRLGEGGRAHGLLLRAHERRMRGAAPKAAFAGLLRAAEDSLAGFSDEPGYLSGLVTWAVGQAEDVAHQARRRVLASGGLRAAGDCVRLCLGHCAELEARGLSLSSAVVRIFRPMLDHALASSLAAVRHSASALAAADDWSLTAHHHPNLSSSAYKFSSMLQELVEDMEPLENFRMEGAALEGVLQEFNSYVDLLVSALPPSIADATGLVENKLVKRAKTETQQIALLGNAWVLADEVLPRVALSLHGETGPTRQRDWKRRFQRCVDRLRDSFCRNHALDLIFTDEGDSRLSPQTYTTMDLTSTAPEWFPSPIFQVLFTKLMRIAGICSQVFVGRERCATVLLIRLLETVILFLSNDQSFWEEIESGEQPLGPQGLQQFYLDMEFVLLFSSQGRFLSRNMHQVIKDIIDRAVDAVQATGIDPYRVLPKGDWFAEMAQIAINILTGKHSFSDEETDPNTPTDSSIYSHGANFD